jgi:MYXO-CTERM domain-containing protein
VAEEDSGCGCRVAGRPAPEERGLLFALLALGASLRRRRSRR